MKASENKLADNQEQLTGSLSRALPYIRKEIGVSQTDLANKVGISRQMISLIERQLRPMTWTLYLAIMYFIKCNYHTNPQDKTSTRYGLWFFEQMQALEYLLDRNNTTFKERFNNIESNDYMLINASVVSNKGKVRTSNEDNFCFAGSVLNNPATPISLSSVFSSERPILFGVFDGMGGMSCGERASLIAAETSKELFSSSAGCGIDILSLLTGICESANDRVCYEIANTLKKRMGSTASMLGIYKDKYYLCNVGDSPIFLFRKNRLAQISIDHTERPLNENSSKNKKYKLTQHIGVFPEETKIVPFTTMGTIHQSDRFIICSDGLTDMMPKSEIRRILTLNYPADKTSELLLNAALEKGGKDNVTVICIDINSKDEASRI